MARHFVYVYLAQNSSLPDSQVSQNQCESDGTSSADLPLRIAAIFIILVGSLGGALFPVLARRSKSLSKRLPKRTFETAKYFGSGVIIGTAFIHLLSPAIEELGSPCLAPAWQEYPYALAFALISIFSIFVVELIALRWGSAKLASLGIQAHDPHSHQQHSPHAHEHGHSHSHAHHEGHSHQSPHGHPHGHANGHAHDEGHSHRHHQSSGRGEPDADAEEAKQTVNALSYGVEKEKVGVRSSISSRSTSGDITVVSEKDPTSKIVSSSDLESSLPLPRATTDTSASALSSIAPNAATAVVGIAILEFGVLLHSFLVGLTLAVTEEFKVLFVVLVIHQTFEGLGVGSRLAYLEVPGMTAHRTRKWALWGAVVFGITTPLGIAVGLGLRSSYNPESATASIVSGVLDAFSAGVLIYTGLVELLAHDFLFNPAVVAVHASERMGNGELAYAVVCVMLGCGGMAVLGRWA